MKAISLSKSHSNNDHYDGSGRSNIIIKKMPLNQFPLHLGIDLNTIQTILASKNILYKDNTLHTIADAVNYRMFSLLRESSLRKQLRLKTNNDTISSLPKIQFILLNAEKNAERGLTFPDIYCDRQTKLYAQALLEKKTFRAYDKLPGQSIFVRNFPKTITESIPQSEHNPSITPYDIFSALDSDKFISQEQKRSLYDSKYFQKHDHKQKPQDEDYGNYNV